MDPQAWIFQYVRNTIDGFRGEPSPLGMPYGPPSLDFQRVCSIIDGFSEVAQSTQGIIWTPQLVLFVQYVRSIINGFRGEPSPLRIPFGPPNFDFEYVRSVIDGVRQKSGPVRICYGPHNLDLSIHPQRN